jgi:molybdate transport system ATP-binding protein
MSLMVNIEKQLGDFHLKVDFETQGGVLGLLGASGCGKSYTLKCIAGIERPYRGRIVLDGVTLFDSDKKIDLPPQKRQVGYLFQNYALFPNMTVRQNILCGLHRQRDKRVKEEELQRVLSLFQLEEVVNHRPYQLSGGQAQRVALARILVNDPKLLMLDEPFSALDSHLRGKLQLEMQALLASYGKDVLMVTHSRDEAYHMCQQIAVMDNGRLLTMQETKRLFADPGSRQAALLTGCKNVVDARKCGDHEVEVPEWGIRLTTAQPVGDGLVAIGIRAHYFNGKTPSNRYPVDYVGSMEEPFECIFQFRYPSQAPDSEPIWWRVSKERLPSPKPTQLGVAPANVLLLYQ